MLDEKEKLKKLLATNFGRLKNDPVKQGRVFKEYEELCGVYHGNHINRESGKVCLSQEQIAKQLGVSPRYLRNLKQLSKLSPDLQELISDGTVKYTTALNIWGKLTNEDQSKLIEELGKDKIKEMKAKDTKEYIDKIQKLEQALMESEVKMNRNRKQEFIVLSANLENKAFIIKNDEQTIKFLNRNKDKESIKEIKRRAKLFEKNIIKKE